MGGFRGGGGQGGRGPPFFPVYFKSSSFGHKCSQNDVKQHHQFLRSPLSGFSGSAPGYYWKERLKISKLAKFQSNMSEVREDIALQSR